MNLKKYTQVTSTQLRYIQIAALILSILGAFVVPWTLSYIFLSIIVYYLFLVVGVGIVLHRYWTHKQFEFKNPVLKYFFTFISIIAARGSPIAWVHVHREHHAHADTDKDPHRPESFKYLSSRDASIIEFKPFLVRDLLTPTNKIIHEYYLLFILAWIGLLLVINPVLVYFAWILPVCLVQIAQDIWNYASHVDCGYRNFVTKDNSRNVIWLWPLILGEAWHNNHHHAPKAVNMKIKKWEYDPAYFLVKLIKK